MEAGTGQRPVDRAVGSRSGDGQDPSSQDLALPSWLAERNSCLAVPVASGISRRNHCHNYFDGLVDHAECSHGRAGESEPDHEPREGALVLPWVAGDAGLLRSVDRRRGNADVDHHRADGDSLY